MRIRVEAAKAAEAAEPAEEAEAAEKAAEAADAAEAVEAMKISLPPDSNITPMANGRKFLPPARRGTSTDFWWIWIYHFQYDVFTTLQMVDASVSYATLPIAWCCSDLPSVSDQKFELYHVPCTISLYILFVELLLHAQGQK